MQYEANVNCFNASTKQSEAADWLSFLRNGKSGESFFAKCSDWRLESHAALCRSHVAAVVDEFVWPPRTQELKRKGKEATEPLPSSKHLEIF